MKNLLLIILFTATSFAQVSEEWVQRYSANGGGASAMIIDSQGNVIVTGNFYLTGGNTDIVTIKYNSEGVQQWLQTYFAGSQGRSTAIAVDEYDNIIITGSSNEDVVTIKYSAAGNQEWVKTYNGPLNDSDRGLAIAIDIEGNAYVTGYVGTMSSSLEGGEERDIITIKYSSSGAQLWEKIYGSHANTGQRDVGRSIQVDQIGNVYVAGYSTDEQNNTNAVTLKYNDNGTLVWDEIYGSPANWSGANKLLIYDDENIYVAGYGGTDFLLIKYNPSGNTQWVQTYSGPGSYGEAVTSMAIDSSGNIYVTGVRGDDYSIITIKYAANGTQNWLSRNTQGYPNYNPHICVDKADNVYVTVESHSSPNQPDILTFKYDATGQQKWFINYTGIGSPSYDRPSHIALDSADNIFVCGGSGSSYSSGGDFATIKYTQGLRITEPQAGEKWIAGETDTIRWTGGQQGQLLDLEYTIDNGNSFSVIQLRVLAESLSYEWTIPNNLISTKVKIRLTDVVNTLISVTSDSFRVKPYIITKVDANGDYISYDRATDVWNFGNFPGDMWPMDWYSQFDYQGIDPFTSSQYSQWQADFTFATSFNSEHPDWITWVNVFGLDACYYNTTLGIYNPSAVLRWEAIKGTWNGSCFGIAGTNALAFSSKDEFLEAYPSFPSFFSPIVVLSDTGVKREVNELFAHQIGNPSQQARINNNRWKTITPNETLNEVKAMLIEDSVKIRTLSLWNNNGGGGHNILLYSLEQDETQKELYYLFVYDNSRPSNTNALILIDTTGNSNQGTWLTTYAWTTWGGPTKLMLEIESSNYLTDPILPNKTREIESPFILSENQLDIHSNLDANVQIVDMQGNITGFINDVLYDEIPEASPLIYLNGSETPPYGYSLPTENYSIVLNEFAEDTVETFFFTGNKSFVYERSGAEQTQTDRLFFDGGISVANPDVQSKTIKLLNLINETTQEKLAVVRSIELAQNDSVKIENPDSNKVKLISYGTAKNYNIELNYVIENGIGRFGNFNVPLEANTSHTFLPVWTDLTNSELMVLVDLGNDGILDDTLSLVNQVTGIGEDQGSLLTPNSYNLAQNFPNPFNPTTTIEYSIPQAGVVTIKIFDILGREVTTLVNEEKQRGNHVVKFNASNLASGVYFYKLQAGSFVETKKMILMR